MVDALQQPQRRVRFTAPRRPGEINLWRLNAVLARSHRHRQRLQMGSALQHQSILILPIAEPIALGRNALRQAQYSGLNLNKIMAINLRLPETDEDLFRHPLFRGKNSRLGGSRHHLVIDNRRLQTHLIAVPRGKPGHQLHLIDGHCQGSFADARFRPQLNHHFRADELRGIDSQAYRSQRYWRLIRNPAGLGVMAGNKLKRIRRFNRRDPHIIIAQLQHGDSVIAGAKIADD